jgi:PAS domain S-box-containing protein
MSDASPPTECDVFLQRLTDWLASHREALLARRPPEHAPAEAAAYAAALEALLARLQGRDDGWAGRAAADLGSSEEPPAGAVLVELAEAARDLMAAEQEPDAEILSHCLAEQVLALHLDLIRSQKTGCEVEISRCRQYEEIFQRAADPMIVLSLQSGRFLAANQAALQISGYTREQAETMTITDIAPDLTERRRLDVRKRLLAGGEIFFDRYPFRRADGTEDQVAVHASLIVFEGEEALLALLHPVLDETEVEARLAAQAAGLRQELLAQSEEQARLREFYENVIDALPLRLIVLDPDLRIVHANPAYYQQRGLTREQILGAPVDEVFAPELMEQAGLRRALEGSLETGERVWWSGFREQSPGHPERIVNIRIDPCLAPDGRRGLLITIEDVSERYRQVYERTLLQEISQAMLSTLDLPRLLHAILTGISAGGAAGLGFNRAILMLVDEQAGVLKAEMAVGPSDVSEAHAIWSELSGRYRTLQDFLQDYDRLPASGRRPLADLVDKLVVPLTDTEHLPLLALLTGEPVHVLDAESDPRVNPEFARLLQSSEFVVAPLFVGEHRLGVAVADNFVTRKVIRGSDVHLLTALANQAALAIDRAQLFREAQARAEELARAYEDLKAAERRLLVNARLATMGQVTAAVAHEIRNPLSTIGGFARAIVRDPGETERNQANAKIIVEEVDRLEELLSNLLDFSRPDTIAEQRVALWPLVQSVLDLTAEDRERAGVTLETQAAPDLPEVDLDPHQFRQVLLNLLRNAVEAMPEGGTLTVRAERTSRGVELSIQDTGAGVPEQSLEHIFDKFFTTKPTGTGLGLALVRRILDAHGAQIEVESVPNQGATFTITLPIPPL